MSKKKESDATKKAEKDAENKESNADSNKEKNSGQIVFETQGDLDKVIQNRLDRQKEQQEKDKDLSELERMTKERDEALLGKKASDNLHAFIGASGLKFGTGKRIFAAVQGDLEFDKDGVISNMKDAIKIAQTEFRGSFPKIIEGTGDGGEGVESGKEGEVDMNQVLRNAAGVRTE